MGCGTSFVKYVLFFFNLVVALLGLAIIGVGVAFQLNWAVIKSELETHNLTVAPWLFIIIGAIMFVIAFFGCCGAIRESHCMVVTYAIFLLVIIIVQVVIAVLMFVYGDTIKDSLVDGVKGLFDRNSGAHVDATTQKAIDTFQTQFECCGKTGPDFFPTLPASCCTKTSTFGNILGGTCTIDAANPGCVQVFTAFYEKWNKPMAGVAIGVACVEVVGALFALCLANSIRNMDRRSRY